MHQLFGVDNLAAKGFANGLVTKANPQQRDLTGIFFNGCQRHTRLRRRTGARRDNQILRL